MSNKTNRLKDIICEDDAGKRRRFIVRCYRRPSKHYKGRYQVWDSRDFRFVMRLASETREETQRYLDTLTVDQYNEWATASNKEAREMFGNKGEQVDFLIEQKHEESGLTNSDTDLGL